MIPQNSTNIDTIFYDVKSGDSLSSIIRMYYGRVTLQQQKKIIENIMLENSEIKNPNLIHPGQTLVIDIPQQYCAIESLPVPSVIQVDKETEKTLKETVKKATPQEMKLMSALAPVMLGTGATSMTMIKQTFQSNAPLLGEMAENYNDYKADKITQGQYNYRRRKIISKFDSKMGPIYRLLNGNKTPSELLRISRKKGIAPTHIINNQAKRMNSLAKLASRGGTVLTVAGLGVACHQIASTDDKQKKNEILVESLGGLGGGILYGFGVSAVILLMATPVGWIAALAIGVGGAAASYGSGFLAKRFYTLHGTNIDFATMTNVNTICR